MDVIAGRLYKIALINMPFAALRLPSIALTQLRAVVTAELDSRVATEIHYANHDFATYFGCDAYGKMTDSVKATVAGFGDWLFRKAAFPELADNTEAYLGRYSATIGAEKSLMDRREGLEPFLDELIDRYRLDQVDLVGFTSMFAQTLPSLAMARRIKARNDRVVTVMGGANCETTMGNVLARNIQAIDFIFSGPALKSFPELLSCLVEGKPDQCDQIGGVLSKAKLAGRSTGVSEIGAELDIDVEIPLDYDDYLASLDEKGLQTRPSLLFETSRGCWWGERSHCTFCGLNGTTMQYRAMSAENALSQFGALFRYSDRVSRYESVDNILPRQYLQDVLPKLEPPRGASIFYEIKADLKDHEMRVLAESGVNEVQPGIEALATSTLKLMRKGTSAFQNLRFLKNCIVYNIKPVWNLLVGFPGEKEKVYAKYVRDLPLLHHLPPPTGVYPVRFDRFSPYATVADSYGLKLKPYDFYSLVYPFPEDELEELAYFFADENLENDYIASTAKWLKRLESAIGDWHDRWQQPGAKPHLALEWHGDVPVICDTRDAATKEHKIEPVGKRVLDALSEPLIMSRLAKKLDDIPEAELEHQVAYLREANLLFEEDERYMSLLIGTDREQGYL